MKEINLIGWEKIENKIEKMCYSIHIHKILKLAGDIGSVENKISIWFYYWDIQLFLSFFLLQNTTTV